MEEILYIIVVLVSNINFGTPWNPKSKQLGGSEEAVINLSKNLVKNGYNVTVYCVLRRKFTSYTE